MTIQEIKLRLKKLIKLIDKQDNSFTSIEDGFDYLSTLIKYILLDLEATKREKKSLESRL